MSVFTDLRSIDLHWVGVQSLIQAERIGIRSGKKYLMANDYISSVISKATTFALWNSLLIGELKIAYIGEAAPRVGEPDSWRLPFKDVVFSEDAAPLSNYNAATTGVYYPQYCH